MVKDMRLAIIAIAISTLSGCGDNKIDTVKNSFYSDTDTVSMGNLLDNRKSCSSVSWDIFENEQKTDTVEYRCYLPSVKNYAVKELEREKVKHNKDEQYKLFQLKKELQEATTKLSSIPKYKAQIKEIDIKISKENQNLTELKVVIKEVKKSQNAIVEKIKKSIKLKQEEQEKLQKEMDNIDGNSAKRTSIWDKINEIRTEVRQLKNATYNPIVKSDDTYKRKCHDGVYHENYDDNAHKLCRSAYSNVKDTILNLEKEKNKTIDKLRFYSTSWTNPENTAIAEKKLEEKKQQLRSEIGNFTPTPFQGKLKYKDGYELWQWGFNKNGTPILTYTGYVFVKPDGRIDEKSENTYTMFLNTKQDR